MVIINKVQSMLYKCCKKAIDNVYDEVPTDKVFPCIVIGDIVVDSEDSKETYFKYSFDINVFSIYSGKKEANEIIEKLINLLNECIDKELQENHLVDDVKLVNASVFKIEGAYQGKANITIDIFEI